MEKVATIHYEIPDDLHRRAKSAAALAGITLKEWLLQAIEAAVDESERPRRTK